MEQAVLYSLDNGFLDSAVFLAEQLYHTDTLNAHYRFLYGLCLLRTSQVDQAHFITRAIKHLGCAYIYARSCLQLKRYKSGIESLLAVQQSWTGCTNFYYHTESSRRLLPDSAAVHCILGELYRRDDEVKFAIYHFVSAIRANPYLFEAFQGLLALGVDMQVKNVFRPSEALSKARLACESDEQTTKTDASTTKHAMPDIFNQPAKNNGSKNYAFRPTMPLTRLDEFETPEGPATPTVGLNLERPSLELIQGTAHAPTRNTRKPKTIASSGSLFGSHRTGNEGSNRVRQRDAAKDESSTALNGQRRSSRLNLSRLSPTKNKRSDRDNAIHQLSKSQPDIKTLTNGKMPSAAVVSNFQSVLPTREAEMALLRLLNRIGEAFYALSKYQCQKSIEFFLAMESSTLASPSILARLARAYYEQGEYEKAAKCYKDLRKIAPEQLKGMEIYSTCLWHLRRETELSYLAHEAFDLDRLSPHSWCILANCFSLKGEHDHAVKCVRRAIQLDSDFAYAYTLEGHELAASEEHELAQVSFRHAIRIDNKHYNAWYGLGMAYLKTKEHAIAEYHFERAAQINPTNAVLVCCVGIAQEHLQKWPEALRQFKLACELAPQSVLARFKKAKALIMARDYKNAMNDLHILKDLAPDEANVHYLLGKMYRQFGDKLSAMKHLTIAMNLDSKASQMVKETIENMDAMDHFMEQR